MATICDKCGLNTFVKEISFEGVLRAKLCRACYDEYITEIVNFSDEWINEEDK